MKKILRQQVFIPGLLLIFLAMTLPAKLFSAFPDAEVPQEKLLIEVLDEISNDHHVYFTYDSDIIKGLMVDYEKREGESVRSILSRVLAEVNMDFKIFEDRFVILFRKDEAGLKSLEKMISHMEEIVKDRKEAFASRRVPVVPRLQSDKWSDVNRKRLVLNVSGRVMDANGEPLIGVNVQVKGTNKGTATDIDGRFSLSDIDDQAVLVLSYIGYQSQEVTLNGQSSLTIVMQEDMEMLDEVVVVGYGTQKKANLTSSISSVAMDDLQMDVGGNARLDNALKGRVPGLQLTEVSGQAGSAPIVRIRGVGTITSGNDPLWVIDGLPTTSSAIIGNLDLNNVKSIDVLKDVAATSIYGSRGANGVIIIETNVGKIAKPQFNISFEQGIANEEKRVDMLSGPENAAFIKRARDNAWIDAGGSLDDPMSDRPFTMQYDTRWNDPNYKIPNYDYQDFVFRNNANMTNASVSASGGSNVGTFFINGSYSNQEGLVKRTSYERYSIQGNMELNLTDFISMNVNFNPSRSITNLPNAYGKGSILSRVALSTPYSFHPMSGVPVPEGEEFVPPISTGYHATPVFGLAVPKLLYLNDVLERTTILGSANIIVDILPELQYKIQGGIIYTGSERTVFNSSLINSVNNQQPSGSFNRSTGNNYVFNQTLTYDVIYNDIHSLSAMIGYSSELSSGYSSSLSGSNYPDDLVETINVAQDINGSTTANEWALVSYIGRLNYNFKERYLINLNIRRDGGSMFGMTNRWGTFPSVSGAWRIEQEDFFQSKVFSRFKIRGSFGISGNNQIGNYTHIPTMSINYQAFGENEVLSSGYSPSNLGNDELTWEKLRAVGVGIDIGMFDDRVSITLDAYRNLTTSSLMNVDLPAHTGFSSQIMNIGEILNQGLEAQISSFNITGKMFNWNTDFTLALNDNEVKALGPNNEPIIFNAYGGMSNYTKVGHPIGQAYLLQEIGVWKSNEEIENNAHWSGARPGDIRIKDTNGDGVITADDRTFLGRPFPLYNLGFRNHFEYKNVSLSFFINSTGGHDLILVPMLRALGGPGQSHTAHYGYWRDFDKPNSGLPEPNDNLTGASSLWTDRGLFDASYIRLKDVTLSYTIPQNIINKLGFLSQARLSLQGHNLWLHDNVPYTFNVEGQTDFTANPLAGGGLNYTSYPLPKEFVINLQISF